MTQQIRPGHRLRRVRIALVAPAAILVFLLATSGAAADHASGPDGSVSWVWGERASNGGLLIELTRIASDGVPYGTVNELNPEPEAPLQYPEQTENSKVVGIVVGPGGVTTVVWLEIVGWNARMVMRRAAADGTPLGEPVTLASNQEIHIRPVIGIGPDGTVTIVWSRLASPGQELVALRIAPDGSPEGGELVLSGPNSSAHWADMTMAADGTAVVVWPDGALGQGKLLERRIAPDGTLAPTTDELASTEWGMGEPELGAASDGSAVALWEQWGTNIDPKELWVRHTGSDGAPVQSGHLLDGAADEIPWWARLYVAPDGSALVVWDTEDGQIEALRIAADGTPENTPILIGSEGPEGGSPAVAAAPDSSFMFLWRETPCGGEDCLQSRRMLSDASLESPQEVDSGSLARDGVIFGPDGTATLLWSRQVGHVEGPGGTSPGRWINFSRQLAPNGTFGPIHEVAAPGPAPVIRSVPTSAQFGEVTVGSSAEKSLTVEPLMMGPVGSFSDSLSGPGADQFEILNTTCSASIAYPDTCSFSVSYSPTGLGPAGAQLELDAGEGKEVAVIQLAGEGAGPKVEGARTDEPKQAAAYPTLRRPRLNRSVGTAALPVVVPGSGSLTVRRPCVGGPAARSPIPVEAGEVELVIAAKSHCRRQLLRTGSTSFVADVVFRPTVGEPSVQRSRITLHLGHR